MSLFLLTKSEAPARREPSAEAIRRFRPVPRWPSREGVDPATGHDATLHAAHLPSDVDDRGHKLDKALPGAPARPRAPRAPAPAPGAPAPAAPNPDLSGQSFHYAPGSGIVHHGTHPAAPGLRRPQLNDHVGIRPLGGSEGTPLQHGRVVGHVDGGVRVRYGQTGREENLVGPQGHRGMVMAPGSHYGRELPPALREPHERAMGHHEARLPADDDPARLRAAMAAGPQVGHRFREVQPVTSGRHPFGELHEVAHVSPDGRHIGVIERHPDAAKLGVFHEMGAEDWHNALQHHSFRPEPPNRGDEHGDQRANRRFFEGVRRDPPPRGTPEEAEEDGRAAERLMNPAIARAAGPAIRHLSGGKHGLQKMVDAYSYQHGPLRSQVTHVESSPEGRVTVRGQVQHDEKGDVGNFARSFYRDRKGQLVAEHQYLELPGDDQGTGFGRGFYEHAERHYGDLGVHRAELHADVTVGKYAWAKHGYDFASERERGQMWERFKDWADHHGHTFPKRDYDQLKKRGSAWDLANYDPAGERIHTVAHDEQTGATHVDGRYHLGKAFLLSPAAGDGWHGVKHLAAGSKHQRQAARQQATQAPPKPEVAKGLALGPLLVKARQAPPPPIRHRRRPTRGMEGAGGPNRDVWYHGGWLIEHDPQVAAGCYLGGQALSDVQKALGAPPVPPVPAPGMPGARQPVSHPGSRGGHFYYDDHGRVRYGVKPTLGHVRMQRGDQVLLGHQHHRVAHALHDSGTLMLHRTSDRQLVPVSADNVGQIAAAAPAAHGQDELPPQLGIAHMRALRENPGGDGWHTEDEPPPDRSRSLRQSMTLNPQAGDRWREWRGSGYGPMLRIARTPEAPDWEVVAEDDQGQQHLFDWQQYQDLIEAPTTRVERPQAPRKPPGTSQVLDDTDTGDDDWSERSWPGEDADDARDMQLPPARRYAGDDSDDDAETMRQAMHEVGPHEGDLLTISRPVSLDGGVTIPAGEAEVVATYGGRVELYNDDGHVGTLDQAAWRQLLGDPDVTPTERGDAPSGGRVASQYDPLTGGLAGADEDQDTPGDDEEEEEEEFTDPGDDQEADEIGALWRSRQMPSGLDAAGMVNHVFGKAAGVTPHDVYGCYDGDFAGGRFSTGGMYLRRHDSENGFTLNGTIYDQGGDKVGRFERSFYLNDQGELEVHHDLMTMGGFDWTPADLTQLGFANAFNTQAEAEYQRLGVKQVSTFANISIGKYVWARQGYDYETPWARRELLDTFGEWCDQHQVKVPPRDWQRLHTGHAWDLAEYVHPEGTQVRIQAYPDVAEDRFLVDGTFDLGRAFLLDDHHEWHQHWDARKVLDDPEHPSQVQSRKYREEKALQAAAPAKPKKKKGGRR